MSLATPVAKSHIVCRGERSPWSHGKQTSAGEVQRAVYFLHSGTFLIKTTEKAMKYKRIQWFPNIVAELLSPEENFAAQSLLLYGYGAVKELDESSHFSLVVFFGLKHFKFVSPKTP